jgi:Holliday junction resolvase-like predicted endonuclease
MIGNKTGKLGEDIAERFLKRKGYEIVQKNYWKPYGEIDIVCQKGDRLHFVEVKSISVDLNNVTRERLRPEDNVHTSKLKKLGKVIQVYLDSFHARLPKTGRSGHGGQVKDWQFDVVIVYIDKVTKKASVRVLENQIFGGRV